MSGRWSSAGLILEPSSTVGKSTAVADSSSSASPGETAAQGAGDRSNVVGQTATYIVRVGVFQRVQQRNRHQRHRRRRLQHKYNKSRTLPRFARFFNQFVLHLTTTTTTTTITTFTSILNDLCKCKCALLFLVFFLLLVLLSVL